MNQFVQGISRILNNENNHTFQHYTFYFIVQSHCRCCCKQVNNWRAESVYSCIFLLVEQYPTEILWLYLLSTHLHSSRPPTVCIKSRHSDNRCIVIRSDWHLHRPVVLCYCWVWWWLCPEGLWLFGVCHWLSRPLTEQRSTQMAQLICMLRCSEDSVSEGGCQTGNSGLSNPAPDGMDTHDFKCLHSPPLYVLEIVHPEHPFFRWSLWQLWNSKGSQWAIM